MPTSADVENIIAKNYGKNGYLIQGLVAKVKDTVANGYSVYGIPADLTSGPFPAFQCCTLYNV